MSIILDSNYAERIVTSFSSWSKERKLHQLLSTTLKFIPQTDKQAKSLKFEFTVVKDVANLSNNLHGGVVAALADELTTFALVVADRFRRPGVSVELSCSYLTPAAVGEVIIIEAKVLKIGRTLGFSEAIFYSKQSGRIIATAKHTKFMETPGLTHALKSKL